MSGGQRVTERAETGRNLLLYSKIAELKAGIDWVPAKRNRGSANSLLPQGECDLLKPAKSIDTGKRAKSQLC